jgi:hypothetical protein
MNADKKQKQEIIQKDYTNLAKLSTPGNPHYGSSVNQDKLKVLESKKDLELRYGKINLNENFKSQRLKKLANGLTERKKSVDPYFVNV